VREQISKIKYLPEEDEGILESYLAVDKNFKELIKGKD
jgi:hypothetical protein